MGLVEAAPGFDVALAGGQTAAIGHHGLIGGLDAVGGGGLAHPGVFRLRKRRGGAEQQHDF
jgi:hypothetical protein